VTVLHWSRISDRVGRKPVILTGLFGLSLSMYCFGLSKTFWGLVLRWEHSLCQTYNKSLIIHLIPAAGVLTAHSVSIQVTFIVDDVVELSLLQPDGNIGVIKRSVLVLLRNLIASY
jgi:MFS family permease